jgi:hypothetical protein
VVKVSRLQWCSTYAGASSKEDASNKFEIKIGYLNMNIGVESLAEGPRTRRTGVEVTVQHMYSLQASINVKIQTRVDI